VVVEIRRAEAGLSCRSRPDRVDAALTTTVQRAVAVTLVEGDEQRRPSTLESVTVQNPRDQTLQIIIPRGYRRGADSTRTPHIITIVRRQPHEVRRGSRVEIVNQNTISDPTTRTGIRKNQLVTATRVACNVLKRNEGIMNRLIRLMRTSVTTRSNVLVFKISLPA
jgi:hypothetical protein